MSDIQAQKSGEVSPAASSPQAAQASQAVPEVKPVAKKRNPILIGALVVGAIAGGVWAFSNWSFGKSHASTEDAYLTGHVVAIAPQVNGAISNIFVKENQEVKAGDILAELDASTYQADVKQAEANLAVAKATASGASSSSDVTSAAGDAQLEMARGGVSQMTSMISGAESDVRRARAALMGVQSNQRTARASIQGAKAGLQGAESTEKRAQDAVSSVRAQLNSAKLAVRAAESNAQAMQANVATAQANSDKASKDEIRYAALFKQDAISAQQLDSANAALTSAQTSVQALKEQQSAATEQVGQARQVVVQREAELKGAQEQVVSAKAAVLQAKAQLTMAQESISSTQAAIMQSEAQLSMAREGVSQAKAKETQAEGQLAQAKTAPRQLDVSHSSANTALAKVAQAESALENSRIALKRTKLYAPVAGVVSKKSAEIGMQLTIGQTIMALVPKEHWVIANFKETQMTDVRVGQRAEVEVDTLPGHKFTGRIQSLAAATGATFSLIPPDNATGNFTKVVQRVPVKILFDEKQENLDSLRSGLSAVVVVETKNSEAK